MTVQTFSRPDMLQAQSLPDTGWPTYCLSPLYLLPQPHPSNPPPSAPLSLHHHSSSSTYLRELGGDQSFAGACMFLQPALLSTRWGSYLLDRRDGVTGAFLWGRSGVDIMWRDQEFKVTQVRAPVVVEFLWQTDWNSPRHFSLSLPCLFTQSQTPMDCSVV